MIYNGTDLVEVIQVHPMDAMHETHYINLVKCANEPMFYVNCCCDEDWCYEFPMDNNSDYERVKFNIMSAIFESDTMEELLDTLSEVFENSFDCECDHCCC